ncbi:MAG: hypothetical protein A3J65_00935 [Candidatus Buchananbacteria bacterium RIFCSPHIGHO2_02_FULL_45_11b]|uniref:Thioredoxin domain-containing protein n=3 Tax=Candidatus Buchananiibacteriota TaxID=1817903 RepID=A0A1G1Y4Y2_9BACT|nr:MAG: hypothetical protein A2663_04125 [Candidatus Buchananbacteria bacterium RIFCSPHIGHO2_01_FULL_46_12]OGY52091.1 MAG: hypothetical protein A3J65_00935 [Candidatus Buchananbacteria bacterium RIFCSPHIGHO2_02_FULL_45_11b]OGY57448.1 MAG: hypothetical protein A3H67_02235 [Candidatus Buchananbacteria bacterium RIFCSPLOWO2_02_FULL_46_11b]
MDDRKFFDLSGKQGLALGFSWGIAIVCLAGLVIVLTGGLTAGGDQGKVLGASVNANAAAQPAPTPAPEVNGDVAKLSPVSASDYIRGHKNAEVTLIMISDFQCPYCQRHEATITQLLKDYGDKIRVVWRNLPLVSIHQYALKAAEASECAGEQGKFWEMHDKIFANQSALTVDNLKSYAKELGADEAKFNRCLDSGKYADKINKQAAEAQAAGVSGTPGTFINDTLVKGAYPIETFKTIIDELLE